MTCVDKTRAGNPQIFLVGSDLYEESAKTKAD